MSFAIITDSTSDISPARAQELGIYVIPLHVIIEGEDLLDQVQITAEEYVARMAGSKQLPHTSQPSAGEFKALFDRVRADGHDSAIFISLCSEWSACYANASLTAEAHELAPQFIADHNDIDTVIIDYAAYEEMYGALQYLRELEINRIAADRVKHGPHEFVPFEDALTAEELAELESMDPDAIPDEDLFE